MTVSPDVLGNAETGNADCRFQRAAVPKTVLLQFSSMLVQDSELLLISWEVVLNQCSVDYFERSVPRLSR